MVETYFYKIEISFVCPYCRASNDVKAAIMLNLQNRDEAAQRAAQIPAKCARCKRVRPIGIGLHVDVTDISQDEFEALRMEHDSPSNI